MKKKKKSIQHGQAVANTLTADVEKPAEIAVSNTLALMQLITVQARGYAVLMICLIEGEREVEDVLLIGSLLGVIVIASLEKFCEQHGLPRYAAAFKVLLPVGAIAGFVAVMEVVL